MIVITEEEEDELIGPLPPPVQDSEVCSSAAVWPCTGILHI